MRRCQVVNKPVISCSSGRQLGLISHFLIDPARLAVASLAVRPKGFNQTASGCVDIASVVQVGDVVLVTSNAMSGSAKLALRRGFQRLSGCEVFTYNGKPLGKVCKHACQPHQEAFWAVSSPVLLAALMSSYSLYRSQAKMLYLCAVHMWLYETQEES